jgi:hypothetical protein
VEVTWPHTIELESRTFEALSHTLVLILRIMCPGSWIMSTENHPGLTTLGCCKGYALEQEDFKYMIDGVAVL